MSVVLIMVDVFKTATIPLEAIHVLATAVTHSIQMGTHVMVCKNTHACCGTFYNDEIILTLDRSFRH